MSRARDAGGAERAGRRPGRSWRSTFLAKIEEWVERSKGKIRADVALDKLVALGYHGIGADDPPGGRPGEGGIYGEAGVRVYRPWVTEPGMWLQYDFGDGPRHRRPSRRCCSAPGWPGRGSGWCSPLRDKTMPSVIAALDVTLAQGRRRADVCADRQREDRHDRARRRDRRSGTRRWSPSPGIYGVTIATCVAG